MKTRVMVLVLALCASLLQACQPDLLIRGFSSPNIRPKVQVVIAQQFPTADCRILLGTPRPVTMSGDLPIDATIQWQASKGTIVQDGPAAVLFPPPVQTAEISIGGQIISNSTTFPIPTLKCNVIDPRLLTPTITLTPTLAQTLTPTLTATPTITPTLTATITPTITLTPTINLDDRTVAITEIMANPCGSGYDEWANEYIELYNYGPHSVNMNGWLLYIQHQVGPGRRIVPWNTRYAGEIILQTATNSTILEPGKFALILSPQYVSMLPKPKRYMPYYNIPPGTVILTPETGPYLGNFGIKADTGDRDRMLLYTGDDHRIDHLVSTYGIRGVSTDPSSIDPLSGYGFPLKPNDCVSIVRKSPIDADAVSSWTVGDVTPGW